MHFVFIYNCIPIRLGTEGVKRLTIFATLRLNAKMLLVASVVILDTNGHLSGGKEKWISASKDYLRTVQEN